MYTCVRLCDAQGKVYIASVCVTLFHSQEMRPKQAPYLTVLNSVQQEPIPVQ